MKNVEDFRTQLTQELARFQHNEIDSVENTDGRIDVVEEKAENVDENADAAKVERDLALEQHALTSIQLIKAALSRIEDGTYGQCINCGNEIPLDRLQAFPAAARCLGCKTEFEAQAS